MFIPYVYVILYTIVYDACQEFTQLCMCCVSHTLYYIYMYMLIFTCILYILCALYYIGALAEDEGENQLNLLLNSLNRSVSGSNALNQTTVSAHTGNLSPSPSLTSPYQTTVHSPVDPLLGGHNYEDGAQVTGGDVYNTVYNNNMAGTTSIGSGSLLKMLKSAKNKVYNVY